MSYIAIVLSRVPEGWAAEEIDLDGVEDLDGLSELLRDLATDAGSDGLTLMLLEEDDEYLAVLRLDGEGDPRVFLSDARVVATNARAALISEEIDTSAARRSTEDDDSDSDTARAQAEPAGDATLLADLGTPAEMLLELVAAKGMLPADVIAELCERAGCLDVLEEIRGV